MANSIASRRINPLVGRRNEVPRGEKYIVLRDSIAIISGMPQILIRKLDQSIVRKLKAKAAAEGVSAEEEARRILRRTLTGDLPTMPLIEFLRTMPSGDDARLFRRRKTNSRPVAL